MPAADLAPLGSQQPSQHAGAGKRELQVQLVELVHDRKVGLRHRPQKPPLDILERLLTTPHLLPHESRNEFLQLFTSLEAYGKPQTTADYMAVYQASVLTWDFLRYQEMKVGVLRSHTALVSLLSKTHEGAAIKGADGIVMADADQKATIWFADLASRPAAVKLLEKAGYSQLKNQPLLER